VAGLGAVLVRPDRRDEPARFGTLRPVRQWIESVIDALKGQLGLEQHGGRTLPGIHTRVGQRLLALAAAVWFNWQLLRQAQAAQRRGPGSALHALDRGQPPGQVEGSGDDGDAPA
jgi:hypothetical protein